MVGEFVAWHPLITPDEPDPQQEWRCEGLMLLDASIFFFVYLAYEEALEMFFKKLRNVSTIYLFILYSIDYGFCICNMIAVYLY